MVFITGSRPWAAIAALLFGAVFARHLRAEGSMITWFRKWCLSFGLALVVPFASAPYAIAQNINTGEIRGTVTDPTGAVVPAVSVVVTNLNTGIASQTTTNSAGIYEALSLLPGDYSVAFAKEGFKKLVEERVSLHVQILTVNATLELGAVTQQVTVTGAVTLVQTETSERSTTLARQMVAELPNAGQSWFNLISVLPGISGGQQGQDAEGTGVSINGVQPYQSNWLVDGGSATFPVSQNPSYSNDLPLAAIAEVDVSTANFSAQYGSGSSVFNVIKRSGTNQFHGSAYEFVQNNILQAANFFTNVWGGTKPVMHWNMYGAALGGPIKRDKAFFFFAYQDNPFSTPYPSYYTFPTAAMRNGDFSAAGIPVIYDRTNAYAPFPGNKIPTGMMNPVAANIQSYFPQPNLPGLSYNYYFNDISGGFIRWYMPKVDYNISSTDRLSVSGTITPYESKWIAPPIPVAEDLEPARENLWRLTDTWMVRPTLLVEVQFSAVRYGGGSTSPTEGKGYPAQLGLKNAPANIFPCISISGYIYTGICPAATATLGEGSYVPAATVTHTKGKHILKYGGEYDKYYQNYSTWGDQQSGNYTFSGIFTRNPAIAGSTGLGYADFLLGLEQTWYASETPMTGGRSQAAELYVQDDYKIKPNLTLNLGLRYTAQTGWSEVHNRLGSFDPTLTNPATNTRGAMWFGELGGPRHALQDSTYKNFAPRVGFAWSPKKDWAIRGSFGLFDLMWGANSYTYGGLGTGLTATGYATSADLITPLPFKLSDPAPSLVYPGASTLTPATLNGASVTYYPQHTSMPYVQQVQFDIQHQFAGGLTLDAAYVHTKGTHLAFTTDANQVPANELGGGQSARPYPQFGYITAYWFDGLSKYNAFQFSVKKAYGHGLTLIANYTWSMSMDTGTGSGWGSGSIDNWQIANSTSANYGLATNDMPQFFNGGFVYNLPFGASRRYLGMKGVPDYIVGGWQLSSIFQLHSGIPFTPVMSTNLSGALSGSWFPDRVGNGTASNPTINMWFDPAAFVQPAANTFGNSGRDILFGPGWRNMDLGVAKDFRLPFLGEAGRLQFRMDAYDVFNHPNFGMPDASIGSWGVGQITSTAFAWPKAGRNIQLGLRLTF